MRLERQQIPIHPTFLPSLRHTAILAGGLGILSVLAILIGTASRVTQIFAEQVLAEYWRTTYDILVRPGGSRLPLEEKYGLVEANYLARIPGGISYEQYQAVKTIPGVEIAAPIAMLTYITDFLELPSPPRPLDAGFYLLEGMILIDQGARVVEHTNRRYYYFGPVSGLESDDPQLVVNEPFSPLSLPVSLLMAGIDPRQETALIGLDEALVEGRYLTGKEPVLLTQETDFISGEPYTRVVVPVLVNRSPYVRFTVKNRLSRVIFSADDLTLEEVLDLGGASFLDTLSVEPIMEKEIDSRRHFGNLVETAWAPDTRYRLLYALEALWQPQGRRYREATPPFPYDSLALQVMPAPPDQGNLGQPPPEIRFQLKTVGVFDVERIPRPPDVNRVPLETYFPPVVTLVRDETGNPVEPKELRPRPGPRSYVLSPPLILTTLEAARLITGDDCASCISAIRVRVALEGCPGDYLSCPLTPANQRKIETVASEIARLTGLDVDIVVGSSPTRVLVLVPEVGWVEEQWIQKNVTLTYKEKVQAGHLALLGTLLLVGTLFTLDLAWAEVVARRRTIALQKALGWRSSTVFRQVLAEVLLAALPATALGALAAWGLSALAGWEQPPAAWLVAVPLLVVALAALGALYPARAAARIPPAVGLRPGEGHLGQAGRHARRQAGLLGYAWQWLLRRRSRTALGALTAGLSAALLVLLLAVTVDRQGALSGTLLGEFILVRIQPQHYAIVAMGFLLAGLSLGNSLLAAVLERRREIGVLKALGWRTKTVVRLFVAEGGLLGLLGGAAGALAGLTAFIALYRALPLSLAWIAVVGMALPMAVGVLAALYPARVAARVPPAEAVRYE